MLNGQRNDCAVYYFGGTNRLHPYFFSFLSSYHSNWKSSKCISQNLLPVGFWFRVHQAEATKFKMPREAETIVLRPVSRPHGLEQL